MKSLGISGVFRQDQLAGGFYSYFENLLRGFAALKQDPRLDDSFSLTVFHGRAGIVCSAPGVEMNSVSDKWGRFVANAWLGAVASRGLDAVLFPNYFTPPVVRAGRVVSVIHDLQFRHMPQFFFPHQMAVSQYLSQAHAAPVRRSGRNFRRRATGYFGRIWDEMGGTGADDSQSNFVGSI
jgi:hypothetical protein